MQIPGDLSPGDIPIHRPGRQTQHLAPVQRPEGRFVRGIELTSVVAEVHLAVPDGVGSQRGRRNAGECTVEQREQEQLHGQIQCC